MDIIFYITVWTSVQCWHGADEMSRVWCCEIWKLLCRELKHRRQSYNQWGRRRIRSCLWQTLHVQWPPLCHQPVRWWEKLLIATISIVSTLYCVRGDREILVAADDTSWAHLNKQIDKWSLVWHQYEFKIKDIKSWFCRSSYEFTCFAISGSRKRESITHLFLSLLFLNMNRPRSWYICSHRRL